MHLLHTTPAFVVSRYPHGDSSRVYKLLTRNKGLLFAHAQGVRELKNRNRYALKTGAHIEVTLVRGREVWRLTGARAGTVDSVPAACIEEVRRVLDLVGKLVPVDDPTSHLYSVVYEGMNALTHAGTCDERAIEALTVLRMLDDLGFVAEPIDMTLRTHFLADRTWSAAVLAYASRERTSLVRMVNAALRAAGR